MVNSLSLLETLYLAKKKQYKKKQQFKKNTNPGSIQMYVPDDTWQLVIIEPNTIKRLKREYLVNSV